MNDLSTILTPTLDLIISFSKVKGARFFAINGYQSGVAGKRKCIKPEIANHVVNLNVNYKRAQAKDIVSLRNLDLNSLEFGEIDNPTAQVAKAELLASLLKLNVGQEVDGVEYTKAMLSDELAAIANELEPTDEAARTKVLAKLSKSNARRSQAQTDIYKKVCNGVSVYVGDNPELKGSLKIHAMSISKDVTTKGIFSPTNSADKTIAKQIINRTLKATKFRRFTIKNIEGNVKVNGDELVFEGTAQKA